MKADITRDTFDPANHFSRVLDQQGRVTLDANGNEQTAILLHYLRALARDLIGPYGAPVDGGGFVLAPDDDGNLSIGAGNFYVDGILVENETPCLYSAQPDYPLASDDALQKEHQQPTGKNFWVYLDVWERHITWIEHEAIREKALGGPDTCTRAKVVWQVKALDMDAVPAIDEATRNRIAALETKRKSLKRQLARATDPAKIAALEADIKAVELEIEALGAAGGGALPAVGCAAPLDQLTGISAASLAARVDPGQKTESPCLTSPDAKYRGAENQLYRVEIHRGGAADEATFKWSRDNGSVATAWFGTEGNDLLVGNAHGFAAGNWIELSHDTLELHGQSGALVKLAKVENGILTVDPASVTSTDALAWSKLLVNPRLRRWSQVQTGDVVLADGAVPVQETTAGDPAWLDLEDGVQIRFAADGKYRVGDYWLIPARVATGNIEWPPDANGKPALRPPHGVQHHYAPLGFLNWGDEGKLTINSCRCEFKPLRECPP
ncbi:MAG: hypothetical protein A3I66_11485 [Burkholderiales bacterium RIFCSPLOWO2_02_FULL_57_36]|nr:MAG: hypothetical protein A3I66_11485 [Burkholderiales bacterium RIFCSPLOWO2_02_FULL_57_36]